MKKLYKFPLMFLAAASLAAGLWAALQKLEWVTTEGFSSFPSFHAALMVCGFLGSLIALERAVALGALWGYLGPLLSGLGGVALMVGAPLRLAQVLFVAGSFVFLAVSFSFLRRLVNAAVWLLILSAFLWFLGNLVWLAAGWHFRVVLWWVGFLLITIAGERFELTHNFLGAGTRRAAALFFLAAGLFLSGTAAFHFGMAWGFRLAGAGMTAIGLWLLLYDIARSNLRGSALQKSMGVNLIAGYAWLVAAGVVAVVLAPTESGLPYDSFLHAFFLGFVFSMIFAHAPVIFPGVTGFKIPYRRSFYLHVFFLHASLILRIAADLMQWERGRAWGGLLNAAALVLFLANNVLSAASSRDNP